MSLIDCLLLNILRVPRKGRIIGRSGIAIWVQNIPSSSNDDFERNQPQTGDLAHSSISANQRKRSRKRRERLTVFQLERAATSEVPWLAHSSSLGNLQRRRVNIFLSKDRHHISLQPHRHGGFEILLAFTTFMCQSRHASYEISYLMPDLGPRVRFSHH